MKIEFPQGAIMAIIHFKCKGCGDEFNYNVGGVKFVAEEERPRFEREI